METEVPQDLSVITDNEQLTELEAALQAEFDALVDAGGADFAVLEDIASAIEAVRAQREANDAAAAAAAEQIETLRSRVHPVAETPEEPEPGDGDGTGNGETPEGEQTPEDASRELEPVAAAAPRQSAPARRSTAPSAAAARRAATRPAAPAAQPQLVITAAADVQGFGAGQAIATDGALDTIAQAMHARARTMGVTQSGTYVDGSAQPTGGAPVIHLDVPNDRPTITEGMTSTQQRDIIDEITRPAALVAAGGWCAPTSPVYDLFRIDAADALLDLPEVNVTRGGVNLPDFLAIADAQTALWTWTEANDIAATATSLVVNKALTSNVATLTTDDPHNIEVGDVVTISGVDSVFNGVYTVTVVGSTTTFSYAKTNANVASVAVSPPGYVVNANPNPTKPCVRVVCPGFTETILEAEGLCVLNGNMTDRAWPELGAAFVGMVMNMHEHRMSNAQLAKIIADATAVTAGAGAIVSDAAEDVLNNAEMQARVTRAQYLMAQNAVIEQVWPTWTLAVMRNSIAMRAGLPPEALRITDDDLIEMFRVRGIRPQFVQGYQQLASNTVAWPTTLKFLSWPAGSYFRGVAPGIDLGVVRDSVLNATNDHTAAWSEQFYLVGKRGPKAREVTLTINIDGKTGGPSA